MPIRTAGLLLALAMTISTVSCASGGDGSSEVDDEPSVDRTITGPGTTEERVLEVDGRTRTYRVHLPAGEHEGPLPLVIGLHGGTGSGRSFEAKTGFSEVADAEGFIVAYPDGSPRKGSTDRRYTWNGGDCCGPARVEDVDDVAFISALIDEISTAYPVDRSAVYATGHSNGGIMAYRLACELSDKIVAIGVFAASLGIASCQPSRPVSVLHVHGDADLNIPIDGGRGPESIAGVDFAPPIDGVRAVAEADACTDEPTSRTNGDLTTLTWSSCADGTTVEFVTIKGASHGWPGGREPRAGEPAPYQGYDATAEIWTFLAAHPRVG